MRYLFIVAWIISFSVHADSDLFGVDLSLCLKKDCMTNEIIYEFKAEDNIEIQAGYNVVHWGDDRGTKFYPLFQVYNRTGKTIGITIGLQLLDQEKSVLIRVTGNRSLSHTTKHEPSYETYVPLNAESISEEIISNTRYMKVVFSKNST